MTERDAEGLIRAIEGTGGLELPRAMEPGGSTPNGLTSGVLGAEAEAPRRAPPGEAPAALFARCTLLLGAMAGFALAEAFLCFAAAGLLARVAGLDRAARLATFDRDAEALVLRDADAFLAGFERLAAFLAVRVFRALVLR